MTSEIVVFVTCPPKVASSIAEKIIEKRLAACVNVVPSIESYFYWDDKIQRENESLLIIKTTKEIFKKLSSFVYNEHPYELPEIIALPITAGLPEYLEWIKSETNS